jgi:beta-glucanase (GH16 family)
MNTQSDRREGSSPLAGRRKSAALIEILEHRRLFATQYHLSFDDEFNSLQLPTYITSGPDAGQLASSPSPNTGWLTRDAYDNTGYYTSNGEQEYYANPAINSYNPFSTSNGILTIAAEPTPTSMQGTGANQTTEPYVSGMLTTAQGYSWEPYNTSSGFSQEYGYFEIRCEVPSGPGLWPAFWMIPEPKLNTSAVSSEYDIFEIPTSSNTADHENTQTIYQTEHLSGTSTQNIYSLPTGSDASTAFHTYGLEWDSTSVRWYVDGKLTATMNNVSNTPMYMLINLAVGGNWPGSPDAATSFPADFKIDYVRAYSDDPDVSAVTAQPGYSVDADTLDAISVAPEPAYSGVILVGLAYLIERRNPDRNRQRASSEQNVSVAD